MKKGFTLVEILVSIALFSIVMTVALGAMFTMVDANRKAQAVNLSMTNLNFALEAMSRSIRTGTVYSCGFSGDCATGGTTLRFTDQERRSIMYRYNSTERSIERSLNGGGTYARLTAPEVLITNMAFYVSGSTPGDTVQPRVLITLRGTAGVNPQTQTSFNIQTTVTQRLLDL